jgi:hypothetical protein
MVGALVGASVMTWPTVVDLKTGMTGHPGNDTWNHAWGLWWVFHGIVEDGRIPVHTDLLNYPEGGSLFFIDTFNALVSLPLQAMFGLAVTYNLVVLFALACTIFGGWMLARHVLRDDCCAAVPAVVYGCSAHLMGQSYNGITETVNAGWIPLYLLALLRLMERPSLRRGLLAGVLMGVCAVSNFYYGLFSVLLSVIVVIHLAITDRGRVRWVQATGALGLAAAVSAILVFPVLSHLAATMGAADAMVSRDPQFVWDSLIRHNISDFISFFRPGKNYSPDLKAQYGEDLLIVTYLGWIALILASISIALQRRRRDLTLWISIFIVFFLFSLGPFLHVNGEYVQLQGRRIPLPFLPFFEALPIFDRISHPFRFVVPASLGLAMLAGHGARLSLRGFSERSRKGWVGVLVILIFGEILLASPAVWPLPRSDARIPAAYSSLQGEGAVLDLPITVPNLERAMYSYFQTEHGMPSPYGLNEPIPRTIWTNRFTRFLIMLESGRAVTLPRHLPDLEIVTGVELLRAQGYRFIVVHEKLYTRAKARMIETVLSAVLGPPRTFSSDGLVLYEIPP